jgi:hypothetical protein
MSTRKQDWIIAISYIALIYATLGVVRVPLGYLRSHGMLRYTIDILFLLCTAFSLRELLTNHPKKIWRLLIFAALLGAYYFIAKSIRLPEEQLHFFEYGLVGIFSLRALRHHSIAPRFLFLSAWLFSSVVGWCDELLQGVTPNRHYDPRDIGFNIVASGLGLLLYCICKNNRTR